MMGIAHRVKHNTLLPGKTQSHNAPELGRFGTSEPRVVGRRPLISSARRVSMATLVSLNPLVASDKELSLDEHSELVRPIDNVSIQQAPSSSVVVTLFLDISCHTGHRPRATGRPHPHRMFESGATRHETASYLVAYLSLTAAPGGIHHRAGFF